MNTFTIISYYPGNEPGYFTTTREDILINTWAEWLATNDDDCRYILYIDGIPALLTHPEEDDPNFILEDDAIVKELIKEKEHQGKHLHRLSIIKSLGKDAP